MLTPRVMELLRLMVEQGEELVVDGLQVWVGEERTSTSTVRLLLNCLALKDVSDTRGLSRFVVSDTGEAILRRPELAREVYEALLANKPFTVMDDRIVLMPDDGSFPHR